MPLLDEETPVPLLTPRGYIPLPGSDEEINPIKPAEKPKPVGPQLGDSVFSMYVGGNILESAFRQSNTVVSAIQKFQDTHGVSNELVDPTYSPWDDVVGTPYEEYWKSTFTHSNNAQYTAALKSSIDRQIADRRTVEAGGAFGTISGIIAGTIDPTLLLPVGGEITLTGKGVWSLAKGAAAGARAGAFGTTAYELGLHASQDTRTLEESAINIGTGIVLGAVVGGAVAGVLTRTQRVASEAGLEHIANMPVPGSVGAAAPHYFSLDDLTINGKITENIAAGTAFSPNLRGNFRESPLARKTYQEISTNVLRQNMHETGLSLGPSVETNINVSLGETIGQALEKHPTFYQAGKKAGFGMASDAFDNSIGRAMRRADQGENEFVTNAAKMWRAQVIDPLTKQAIDLGMLPEDVAITEAPSYFSRMYNVERMTARKPEFMQIATDHFNDVLQQQYAKSVQALQTKQADLGEELANLKLSPEDRVKKLELVQAQRDALEEEFADAASIADRVRNLRAEARAAKESGDVAGEEAAKQKIENLKSAGGEEFQTFKKEEAKLKKTARQVNLGYAGLQEKADSISQQLTDLSANNFKSLQRLVARGQKLATQLKKLDPEKLRSTVSDLRSDFYSLIIKSERSQDQLAKQIEKLHLDEDKKVQSALAEAGLNKEKLNKTEAKKALTIEKNVRSANTAITSKLEAGLAAEKGRTERLSKISDRLQAAEAIDNSADLSELRATVDSMTLEISNKALGRGERATELLARLAKLDPKRVDEHVTQLEQLQKDIARNFYDKWEVKRLGEGVDIGGEVAPDFSVHAKDMAQEVYDSITGNDYGSASVDPQFHLSARSGPLKDRTFHIPDEKIEPFLEDSVVKVMSKFARTMSAQVELARKFPGDALLTNRFQEIKNEYDILVNHATTEKERSALQKDMKGAFRDLRALLEIHRGSYKAQENAGSWGRVVRGLMQFNYLRSMGGAAIPSLSDIYGPAVFHGLTRTMDAGIPNLLKAITKNGSLVKEARYAGVAERLSHHRLLTLTEIGDPYAQGTAIERLLDTGTHVASKWNGLNMLTDFQKAFDGIVVQDRMNTSLLKGTDDKFLAYSGMDATTRSRVKEQLQAHMTEEDGITVANTDQWDDFDAVRAYRAAINFNVNADIVTRGIGDVPLAAYHPLGKMFLQFKTFNLAAHQRTMLRATQLGPAQFLSGLIGLTTLGMFATVLRAWRGGEENWKRFANSASNPGYMVGEGLDATGFFTLPIELSNIAEKVSAQGGYAVNPVKSPLMLAGRAFVPDASLQANSQRYAGKGVVSTLAGPSAGLVEDFATASGIPVDLATGKEIPQSKFNAANRIVPYQSYLGMREMIQVLEGNSPYVEEAQ